MRILRELIDDETRRSIRMSARASRRAATISAQAYIEALHSATR